jgi:hypothetical protein
MNDRKELLIVDLDDTLIDTSSFKKDLFFALADKSELPYSKIEEIYLVCKIDGYSNLFSRFCRQICKLSKEKDLNCEEILRLTLEKIKIKRKILKYVKDYRGYKILLTLGDKKIQKAKIDFLEKKIDLLSIFNSVKIISHSKSSYICSLIKSNHLILNNKRFGKVAILDDRNHLLERLKKYSWIKILDLKSLT